jgi:large subunit ribosomal protein L13Ae
MVPQKTERGQLALARLSVFEGIPPPYDKQKRMVVPEALQVMRLAPGRRFCVVGRLATEVGWKYGDLVERLESKRKVESEAYYQTKKAAKAIREKAIKQADFSAVQPVLEQFGY